MSNRDVLASAALLGLVALFFLLPVFFGKTFFWGDLTYLHHPWRALPAEMIQRGVLPLWNPFAYFGMPLAAQMQCASWYPGTLPFYLFHFRTGLFIFHIVHYSLIGIGAFLWLRSLGFRHMASFAGSSVAILWGGFVSRISFLNHVSTLAYFPILLLMSGRPILLALSVALSFLSGYPMMLVGMIAAAFVLSTTQRLWLSRRQVPWRISSLLSHLRIWVMAGLLSLGLTACLFLPGAELAMESLRGAGLSLEESLTWSFTLPDLIQFTAPPLIPAEQYSPAWFWWRTCYLGLGACVAAGIGLIHLGPTGALFALAYLLSVLLLMLGHSNPISFWLWTHLGALRYIRYPGNMAYLLSPMVWVLVAAGQSSVLIRQRRPKTILGWLLACGIALELLVYAAGSQPLVRSAYFRDPGPLVRVLRKELDAHRYLLSPLALKWHRGHGPDAESAFSDLKYRLYGVTNMPYHLYAAGNFGEPLVPQGSYRFMDFLYQLPGLTELAPYLGWADIRLVLTRDPMAPGPLLYLGDSLWHMYRASGPAARAFWFDERQGLRIPSTLDGAALPPLDSAMPLELRRVREDHFHVTGVFEQSGWVFICEPRVSGWQVSLNGKPVETEQALGAFYKIRVPQGGWELEFRYDPISWKAGVFISQICLMVLFAYGCRSLLKRAP